MEAPPPNARELVALLLADNRIEDLARAQLSAHRRASRDRWAEDPKAFRMENRTVGTRGDRWYRDVFQPWQEAHLFEPMDARKNVWAEAPRGHDRTDAVAWAISHLLEYGPPGQFIPIAASDSDQAKIDVGRARGLVTRQRGLFPHLTVHENRMLRFDENGQILSQAVIVAADAAGSLGHLPTLVVFEELAAWPEKRVAEELKDSLIGAAAKGTDDRPVPIWIFTNAGAGKKGNWRWEMREAFRRKAEANPSRWHFWSAPGWVAPWSVGQKDELAPLLTPKGKARFVDNRWLDANENPFFESAHVEGVFSLGVFRDPEPEEVAAWAIGCDYGRVKDAAVVVLLALLRDGRILVVEALGFAGSHDDPVKIRDVERVLLRLAAERPIFASAIDKWQMQRTIERFGSRLRTVDFNFTPGSKRALATLIGQSVRNGLLFAKPDAARRRHSAGEVYDLRREMEEAIDVQSSTGSVLEHPPGGYNDALMAVGLGLFALKDASLEPAAVGTKSAASRRSEAKASSRYGFRRAIGGAGGANGSRR